MWFLFELLFRCWLIPDDLEACVWFVNLIFAGAELFSFFFFLDK